MRIEVSLRRIQNSLDCYECYRSSKLPRLQEIDFSLPECPSNLRNECFEIHVPFRQQNYGHMGPFPAGEECSWFKQLVRLHMLLVLSSGQCVPFLCLQ